MKNRSDDPLHHEQKLLNGATSRSKFGWIQVFLYASSHGPDNKYHGICYTSRGALAGTRNSSMGPPWIIDPTTHRTMSERSYHGDTSRPLLNEWALPFVHASRSPGEAVTVVIRMWVVSYRRRSGRSSEKTNYLSLTLQSPTRCLNKHVAPGQTRATAV